MMRIHILLYNSIRIPTMAIKKKDSSKHLTSFHLRSYYSTYDFHNFYHLILLYLRVNSSTVSIFSLRPHTTLHTLPLPIFYFSLPQHTKLSLSLVRELIFVPVSPRTSLVETDRKIVLFSSFVLLLICPNILSAYEQPQLM